MNRQISRLMTFVLLFGPIAAYSQVTTLTYQGGVMSGFYYGQSYQPTPVTGDTLTAALTYDGSFTANNLSLVSSSFQIVNPSATAPSLAGLFGPFGLPNGPFPSIFETTSNGDLTGAIVNWNYEPYGGSSGSQNSFSLGGPQGDSAMSIFTDGNYPQCQNPYCGTGIIEGGGRGTWTVKTYPAPEIDPTSVVAGLTILLGSLMVLQGRGANPRLPA